MRLTSAIAHAAPIDVLARTLSIASFAVALGSLLLTWRLWKQSGGELSATLRGRVDHVYGSEEHTGEQVIFNVNVVNTGRMAAVVRDVSVVRLHSRWQLTRWLNWWFRLRHNDWAVGATGYPVEEGNLRKGIPETESRYPQEILPTAYLKVRVYMDADLVTPEDQWARAIVIRGDNHSSLSPPIPMPRPLLKGS